MRYSGRKFKLRIFPNNLFVRLVFLITYPCLLLLSSHSYATAETVSDLEGQIKSHVEGIYALLKGKTGVSEKKRSSEEISAELGEIMEEIESIRPWKDKTSDDVQQTLERIKDL